MNNLKAYDTNQSIDNDIEDIIKLKNDDKKLDILIMNVIQKYSLFYMLWEWKLDEKLSLENIRDEIKYRILSLEKEKKDLIFEQYYSRKFFERKTKQLLKTEKKELEWYMYSLDCLLDIHSTAEIFKEIILSKIQKKDSIWLVELGSWSWIFSLAWFISSQKSWNLNTKWMLFDQASKSIIHSDNVLNQLNITREKVYILNRDITLKNSYEYLEYFGSIDIIIAEIFSKHIARFKYDWNSKTLVSNERFSWDFNLKNEESRNVDPLFEALNLLNRLHKIFDKTEKWETILFPDLTKNHLNINWEDSSLYLKYLEKNLNLKDIWNTFKNFQTISSEIKFENEDKKLRRWE